MSAKHSSGGRLGKGLRSEEPEGPCACCAVHSLRSQLTPPPPSGQARKRFDKEALEGLAQSIAIHGVIQPLIVGEQGKGTA